MIELPYLTPFYTTRAFLPVVSPSAPVISST